jgi:hypothetical protein
MEEKKPLKAKNLKIIDYIGTYYATFDGTKYWTVEKYIFKLLMMCNGKKTLDQIAEEIARISGFPLEEIKVGLKPIFEEFERTGFITYA